MVICGFSLVCLQFLNRILSNTIWSEQNRTSEGPLCLDFLGFCRQCITIKETKSEGLKVQMLKEH